MNAYQAGRAAAYRGAAKATCPHLEWTSDAMAWRAGWTDAKAFIDACAAKKWRYAS